MNPGDILTDLDVLAEDIEAATSFGSSPLAPKRMSAIEWAKVRMEKSGLRPRLHSTRVEPTAYHYTSGDWTDVSDDLGSKTPDDLSLATAIVSASDDYLLVGSPLPFRGLYVAMVDSVNVNSQTVGQFTYWDGGTWRTPNSLADGTLSLTNSASFSGGGRVTWMMPDNWQRRSYDGSGTEPFLYYMRVKLNRVPTGAIGQLLPIRQSRLTRPLALYTLGLLYTEGIAGTRGNWAEKANRFLASASSELEIVLGGTGIMDEFDADESEAVGTGDINSVTPPYTHQWLRG